MNIDLTDKNLTQNEKKEIEKLLKRENHNIKDDLEQMWFLMDLIWDEYGCDSKNWNFENIGKFYSHPVWLLNGLFIEQHDMSMRHRHAISDWMIQKKFKNIVDYGGGFGTLARLVAEKDSNIVMDIYEPYSSEFGLKRASEFRNIHIINKLGEKYDCLVATDVLEHIPDPLGVFEKMVKSVKVGGYLVIANCFYPVIKCHLPQMFHFRYSFNCFAKMMGLDVVGLLENSHATIYKKRVEVQPSWKRIRIYENISKIVFPIIEILKPVLKPLKRMFVK